MKVCGIIAEYNPFHNGHIYHINKSKEATDSDAVVVIMSGNFVQRGGPAIVDKWSRSKCAVQNGADLIIELPYVYASQTAEIFASGAVKILDNLNSVNFLSFGSESDNLTELESIAKILFDEPEQYSLELSKNMKSGLNFPQSREKALESYLCKDIPELSEPNNILAIEYLKSIYGISSDIVAKNICRYNSSHNSDKLLDDISSATSIRKVLLKDKYNIDMSLDTLSTSIPIETLKELKQFYDAYSGYNSFDRLYSLLAYRIISDKNIDNIFDLDEDLKNRIANSIDKTDNMDELINSIKSKNYTLTRIRRVLTNIVMNTTKEDIEMFKSNTPGYIRVLASSKKGFQILNKIKKNSDIRIINRFSDVDSLDSEIDRRMIKYEILSTDLYYLLLGKSLINQDYLRTPYILK